MFNILKKFPLNGLRMVQKVEFGEMLLYAHVSL